MKKVVALALVTLAVAAVSVSVAEAGPTPAQKCTGSKLKATGKKAAAKLKCHEKAIKKGIAVDPACLAKAEEKFADAFAKAEAKGGCLTTGDTGSIEGLVDTFVDDAVAALDPPVPVSFATDVQPIFSGRCATSGCHMGGSPAGSLSLEAGVAYGNIVNVASSEVPAVSRVLPGDASNSYIYQKITDAPGILFSPMPFGSYPMPSDDIDTIESWINQGALDN
jgi:hypothetical protein